MSHDTVTVQPGGHVYDADSACRCNRRVPPTIAATRRPVAFQVRRVGIRYSNGPFNASGREWQVGRRARIPFCMRFLDPGIGIGGSLSDCTPATPPGMRVRTGRFEKLRSRETGHAEVIEIGNRQHLLRSCVLSVLSRTARFVADRITHGFTTGYADPPRACGHLTPCWLYRHGLEHSSSFGPSSLRTITASADFSHRLAPSSFQI